jgi:hypothetical protein
VKFGIYSFSPLLLAILYKPYITFGTRNKAIYLLLLSPSKRKAKPVKKEAKGRAMVPLTLPEIRLA